MLLFSTMSGFVTPNPALSGNIEFEFIIEKNISDSFLKPYITENNIGQSKTMFPQ